MSRSSKRWIGPNLGVHQELIEEPVRPLAEFSLDGMIVPNFFHEVGAGRYLRNHSIRT